MESTTINNAIKKVREFFNEIRASLSLEETKRTRKEFYKKEVVYNFVKEKEQEGSLTNKQKNVLKNISRYLKKLNNDLKKLNKYQDNITYGLDYLFNEEDCYKPTEVKSAFDGNYVLYESRGDKDANLALYEYFDKIKPYLKDMIDDYKSIGEWKIQIAMRIIFISFIDRNETQIMHTKSDNVEIMNGTDTSDAINKLIGSFMKRYQEGLETKMKGSSFKFERIDLLEYHLHKISFNRGSSYIESPEWLHNKGVTINPKNTEDNNCFQYAITAALNYQNIGGHPERISKLKPFINNHNWKDIEFLSHYKDWRKFECNDKAIALNILFVPNNTEEIRQACISEHNDERNNQVNLLMITDGTSNWHYLAIKIISGLLRGITSNHNRDFYYLNCLHLYRTKSKLKKHEKICKNHDFYYLKMPDVDSNILESKPGKKSLKHAFFIYADLEYLLLKMNTCNNNPNKSYTTAKGLHKPSGYSLLTSCSFDKSENKQTYYRGRDCMKRFCDDLKKHVTRITNYEMKPMDPLTEEEKESYKNQELYHICEKEFCTNNNKEKRKIRDHCHHTGKYRGAAHSKCNLNYKIVEEIPVLFHNGSVYDYHFIIKYLAREFKGNSECLGEITEKYISFTVPFKKAINDEEVKYKIRISDSCRFMQDSLSNLVDNLSELKIKEIDNDVLIKRFLIHVN